MTRGLLAGLATALLAGVFALLVGGVAAAHSFPVSSEPANGSQVDSVPPRVGITFNENLQHSFPSMTVVGPDGNLWSKGEPTIDGPTISIEVGALGPVGEYKMAYRVTSADGHPVSGVRTFTLTKAGTGTPGPKPGAAGTGSGGTSGGVPVWVFIVAAVVLFGGGLGFVLFGGRRGARRGGG
jgi:methionine-rich copper-binding protein CopC